MMDFSQEEQDLENKGKEKAKDEMDQRLGGNNQSQQGDQPDQQQSNQ